MEETKVTNGVEASTLQTRCKRLEGRLSTSKYRQGEDKDIVTNLTEAVDQLKINSVSLIKQLINAMKLNLDMDRELNIKATQSQDPEYKIMAEKAKRKATF